MKFRIVSTLLMTSVFSITACTQSSDDAPGSSESSNHAHSGHDHPSDGGAPPTGIVAASNPLFAIGTEVVLNADHMTGMNGAEATISGAFSTTTYSVSFTPTTGGSQISDHRWVVHEELLSPDSAPLASGTEVVLNADHMTGMNGAEATIDHATQETVYMVDLEIDGMKMTNHKWVTESEISPA